MSLLVPPDAYGRFMGRYAEPLAEADDEDRAFERWRSGYPSRIESLGAEEPS
jgi:hypothetical protein